MKNNENDVRNIIKKRRKELGLTMKELAQKVGVSEGTISRWESGNIANMRKDKLPALAETLQISIETITGGKEPQAKTVTLADQQEELLHDNYCALTPSGRSTLTSYSSFLRAQNSAQPPAPDADLKAAHYRDDIDVADEMKKHDDDIMNDDNF